MRHVEAAVWYHELPKGAGLRTRHGIQLHDGGCVFDVGANIGLYSPLLMGRTGACAYLLSSPYRSSTNYLERNLALYQADAQVTSLDCALDREAGTAED